MPSAGSASSTPAAANNSRASARLNRRSSARISVSSPSSRNRCNPSRTSCRVASTNRSSAGARITSSSSCRRASAEPSSCRSSITSHSRSPSGARSFSSRSTIAHPSRSGAAVSARTSADPADVWRSAPSTDSQNRCGSRSSRPAGTHAARSARPASPIQDRSSTVLPLPGGADTTVTRADAPSRSHNPGRDTTAARAAQRRNIACTATTSRASAGHSLTMSFLSLSPSQRRRICGWLPLVSWRYCSRCLALRLRRPARPSHGLSDVCEFLAGATISRTARRILACAGGRAILPRVPFGDTLMDANRT